MDNETNGGMSLWNGGPSQGSSLAIEVEKSRAVTEVQAALVIAKRFPRDEFEAHTRIMKACERSSLAKAALYSYPRGGQTVTGPSIRLAEVLAQNWGNMETDVVILETLEDRTKCVAVCWDLQTNYRNKVPFEVPHEIQLKNGSMKKLTDPRDIREHIDNIGARKKRQAIIGVIPGDVVADAIDRCRKVVALGDKNDPLDARIKRVLLAFKELGVTQQMLELKLEHSMDIATQDDLVELQGIYNALKDGASRDEFFDMKPASAPLDSMKSILNKEDLKPKK